MEVGYGVDDCVPTKAPIEWKVARGKIPRGARY